MFASGEGQEEVRTEPIAADARELGTPRGAGDPADVLHEAPGLPPQPNRHGRARAMTVFSPPGRGTGHRAACGGWTASRPRVRVPPHCGGSVPSGTW